MQCKACNNQTQFLEHEHKYFTVEYDSNGNLVRKDLVPYQWKTQVFCAICKQLITESQ